VTSPTPTQAKRQFSTISDPTTVYRQMSRPIVAIAMETGLLARMFRNYINKQNPVKIEQGLSAALPMKVHSPLHQGGTAQNCRLESEGLPRRKGT
jgi:hypothetical protein